jgi:hypothetical protein
LRFARRFVGPCAATTLTTPAGGRLFAIAPASAIGITLSFPRTLALANTSAPAQLWWLVAIP